MANGQEISLESTPSAIAVGTQVTPRFAPGLSTLLWAPAACRGTGL